MIIIAPYAQKLRIKEEIKMATKNISMSLTKMEISIELGYEFDGRIKLEYLKELLLLKEEVIQQFLKPINTGEIWC